MRCVVQKEIARIWEFVSQSSSKIVAVVRSKYRIKQYHHHIKYRTTILQFTAMEFFLKGAVLSAKR
jgi:hypothetical protein